MSKIKRLNQVYKNAERISFTDEDRIVFFSDVHRGNNSWADDFAKNEFIYLCALQHYYDAGFTYVEVGDGDEIIKFRYVELLRIAHEEVYALLQKFQKEDRFYYIFGNHDYAYSNPEVFANVLNRRISWYGEKEEKLFDNFCVHESLIFCHAETGAEFFVVHGHQGEFLSDRLAWLSSILVYRLWRPLQSVGLQDPTSVGNNVYKSKEMEKQLKAWVKKTNIPMICGHTHMERFPKKRDIPYFNTGSVVHPRWVSCIEIKNGKIGLVHWHIKARKKGTLYVKREVISGFKKLSRYAKRLIEEPIPVDLNIAEKEDLEVMEPV